MRSTPTTPYSDFIFLLDKALRSSQECVVRGEYNTVKGAYKDYFGEHYNKFFDFNNSIWYGGTFGQISSWEVYIVVAPVNKENTNNEPVVLVDAFLHRRKFIAILDSSVVDCCYFAGNTVKSYTDEEKKSMLIMVQNYITSLIYLFVKHVVMENNQIADEEKFIGKVKSIASHMAAWYIYNYSRATKETIRENLTIFTKLGIKAMNKTDDFTEEDIKDLIDVEMKAMEYEGIFNGSFPDIDKLEGGFFRSGFDSFPIFDRVENRKPTKTEEAPKKTTTRKKTTSTTTTKKTTAKKPTKKEETVDDKKD